ncbi:MAG: hypothetical protein AAGC44_12915, partial [Planctomycetota bacterium]
QRGGIVSLAKGDIHVESPKGKRHHADSDARAQPYKRLARTRFMRDAYKPVLRFGIESASFKSSSTLLSHLYDTVA